MSVGLFGQTVIEPVRVKQLDLFHQPVFIAKPEPERLGKFDEKATEPIKFTPRRVYTKRGIRRAPGSLADELEAVLIHLKIPYCNVDQAKKAIATTCKLRSFNFVAYAKDGANWLILCRNPDQEEIDDMRTWEQVFGDGFKAVFCWRLRHSGELHFAPLNGGRIELEDLQ